MDNTVIMPTYKPTYKIIRFHANGPELNAVIATGLTLEEAQEHCSREDTHYPGTGDETIGFFDPWFDGYIEE